MQMDGGEEYDRDWEQYSAVESVGIFSGEANWVATGGADRMLRIWDIANGNCRITCLHGGSVVSLRWHPRVPVICTGALDRLVRLWDGRSGQLMQQFSGHMDMVTSIDFKQVSNLAPDGTVQGPPTEVVASVSDDNTCKIFVITGVIQ